jgi:hypothetical protein
MSPLLLILNLDFAVWRWWRLLRLRPRRRNRHRWSCPHHPDRGASHPAGVDAAGVACFAWKSGLIQPDPLAANH